MSRVSAVTSTDLTMIVSLEWPPVGPRPVPDL
jgi:hypothetical protein